MQTLKGIKQIFYYAKYFINSEAEGVEDRDVNPLNFTFSVPLFLIKIKKFCTLPVLCKFSCRSNTHHVLERKCFVEF